jgi:molecular chaperone GrpE (heat shock protein)
MEALTPIDLLKHKRDELKTIPGVDPHLIIEYEKGFTLNDRLLRPAKVVIAKNN